MEPRVESESMIQDLRSNHRFINVPESADVIQSSLNNQQHGQLPRYASPLFFNLFSSFYASLIQLITTSTTTIVSTLTSTLTSYSTTATSSFTIKGCVPATLYFSTCKTNFFLSNYIFNLKSNCAGSQAAIGRTPAGVSVISKVAEMVDQRSRPSPATVTVTITGNKNQNLIN